MIALTVPEIKHLLAEALARPHARRAHRTLARLATPSTGLIPLVPPARTAKPRICTGQLAIGGCRY